MKLTIELEVKTHQMAKVVLGSLGIKTEKYHESTPNIPPHGELIKDRPHTVIRADGRPVRFTLED